MLRITVVPHGPYRVEGDLVLVDSGHAPFCLPDAPAIELCRCGLSAAMPFCDQRHTRSGFHSSPPARALLPPPVPPRPMSDTRIVVNPHGAFRVEGEFELVDGMGERFGLAGRTSVSLCRCGTTERAPFCDGSHNSCRFRDDARAR